MSNLSTFYPAPITAADLGLGAGSNATFGSVTTGAINASGGGAIQNTPIGDTTPSTGAFTTLTANNGTLTASSPVLDLAQTWNNAAVAFTGFLVNATETAAGAGSLLMALQRGGTSQFIVRRDGVTAGSLFAIGTNTLGNTLMNTGVRLLSGSTLSWSDNASSVYGTLDVVLIRDAANTFAQRNGTTAQTFNIYNTFTSATNHERGFLKWSSNVFQIGTEKGSAGGTARDLEVSVDGNILFRIGSGAPRIAGGLINYVGNVNSVAQVGFGSFGFVAGGANNSGGILFYNGNGADVSTRLGLDASNVLAIKSGTAAQAFRIYNTTTWERLNIRWASNECIIDTEAGGTGTLRGLKIGSASTSLLGFYGATPAVQPAAVADATNGQSTQDRLNDLLARLRTLGLIATT
jgi:hypothetical protein